MVRWRSYEATKCPEWKTRRQRDKATLVSGTFAASLQAIRLSLSAYYQRKAALTCAQLCAHDTPTRC